MDTNELGAAERTIPPAEPPASEMVREIYRAIFVGDGKVEGSPAILHAVGDLLKRVTKLEQQLSDAQKQRLNWQNGLGLAAVGGGISQAIGFVFHHLKGGS